MVLATFFSPMIFFPLLFSQHCIIAHSIGCHTLLLPSVMLGDDQSNLSSSVLVLVGGSLFLFAMLGVEKVCLLPHQSSSSPLVLVSPNSLKLHPKFWCWCDEIQVVSRERWTEAVAMFRCRHNAVRIANGEGRMEATL